MISEFLRSYCEVINVEWNIAQRYSEFKANLRKTGNLKPDNDLWIVATALEHNLTIATKDKHIYNLRGVKVEKW